MVAGKRLRSQNEKRLQTARWVVKNIFTELRKDEKRLLSTNRLLPQGTLRRNCMKRIFGDWTMHAEGRWFTKKLATLVCSKLRKKFGMEMSEVENHRMLTMLKLGRKHRVKKPKMSCMDNLDTLPLACAADRPCQATMWTAIAWMHDRAICPEFVARAGPWHWWDNWCSATWVGRNVTWLLYVAFLQQPLFAYGILFDVFLTLNCACRLYPNRFRWLVLNWLRVIYICLFDLQSEITSGKDKKGGHTRVPWLMASECVWWIHACMHLCM